MNQYNNDKELREFLKENLSISIDTKYDGDGSGNTQQISVKLHLKTAEGQLETISDDWGRIHVD